MAEDGVIGADGALPWRLSADLKRFKALTTGHPILMGRKTYESIGKPLANRRNLVLTRDTQWSAHGVEPVHDLEAALALCESSQTLFVIGGAQVYELALPWADRLELTLVHARVGGDTYFPQWDEAAWELREQSHHAADEKNDYAMTFRSYSRVSANCRTPEARAD